MPLKSRKTEIHYTWLIAFMLTTIAWMVSTGIILSEKMTLGGTVNWGPVLTNELTGSYSTLLLIPGLFWFFKRFPIQRHNWYHRIFNHIIVLVIFGLCHTSLMTMTRKLLYPLMGWAEYNPGILQFRYLMEFQKQFLAYWFIYAVYSIFHYIRKNQERQIQTSLLEKQLSQAKLDVLKMQLNPHFLFNTLNMISSAMYEDIHKADRMLVNLSDFLRTTLTSQRSQLVPLKDEIEILLLYLKIMKARFEEKLVVELDIDDSTLDALFPSLILQTLVENAIKHSSDQQDHITQIRIQSRRKNDSLTLTLQDNGPGLPRDMDQSHSKGIGLSSTQDRLTHLYGNDHQFTIDNLSQGGLKITLTLPFEQDKE